jgi:molecular chaperone GrpE (heat shock protein)
MSEGSAKAEGPGLLGKLGGALREAIWEPASVQTDAAVPASEVAGVSPAASPKVAPRVSKSEANSKLVEQLKQAVLNKPSAFTQLLDQVEALREVGLDEPKQFQAAFATVKKSAKLTLRDILAAVEKLHLGVLESEQNQFDTEIEQVLRDTVGTKERELKSLANQLAEKQQQLAELQAEVAQLKPQQEQVEAEIAAQTKKVEDRKTEFAQAKQAVADWLGEFKEKIATHLGSQG